MLYAMMGFPQNSLIFFLGMRFDPPRAGMTQRSFISKYPLYIFPHIVLSPRLDYEVRTLPKYDGAGRNIRILNVGVCRNNYMRSNLAAAQNLAVAQHKDRFSERGILAMVISHRTTLRKAAELAGPAVVALAIRGASFVASARLNYFPDGLDYIRDV